MHRMGSCAPTAGDHLNDRHDKGFDGEYRRWLAPIGRTAAKTLLAPALAHESSILGKGAY